MNVDKIHSAPHSIPSNARLHTTIKFSSSSVILLPRQGEVSSCRGFSTNIQTQSAPSRLVKCASTSIPSQNCFFHNRVPQYFECFERVLRWCAASSSCAYREISNNENVYHFKDQHRLIVLFVVSTRFEVTPKKTAHTVQHKYRARWPNLNRTSS